MLGVISQCGDGIVAGSETCDLGTNIDSQFFDGSTGAGQDGTEPACNDPVSLAQFCLNNYGFSGYTLGQSHSTTYCAQWVGQGWVDQSASSYNDVICYRGGGNGVACIPTPGQSCTYCSSSCANTLTCGPGYTWTGSSCQLTCPVANAGTINAGCHQGVSGSYYTSPSYYCYNSVCTFCSSGYVWSGSMCQQSCPAAQINTVNVGILDTNSGPGSCIHWNGCSSGYNFHTDATYYAPANNDCFICDAGYKWDGTQCKQDCQITGVSITPGTGCTGINCVSGNQLNVQVSHSGNCVGAKNIQVDFTTADNSCRIQYDFGEIVGINKIFSSGLGNVVQTESYVYILPLIPSQCDGKTLTKVVALARNAVPGVGAAVSNTFSSTISGITLKGICGDGVVNAGEECDLGSIDNGPGSICSSFCKTTNCAIQSISVTCPGGACNNINPMTVSVTVAGLSGGLGSCGLADNLQVDLKNTDGSCDIDAVSPPANIIGVSGAVNFASTGAQTFTYTLSSIPDVCAGKTLTSVKGAMLRQGAGGIERATSVYVTPILPLLLDQCNSTTTPIINWDYGYGRFAESPKYDLYNSSGNFTHVCSGNFAKPVVIDDVNAGIKLYNASKAGYDTYLCSNTVSNGICEDNYCDPANCAATANVCGRHAISDADCGVHAYARCTDILNSSGSLVGNVCDRAPELLPTSLATSLVTHNLHTVCTGCAYVNSDKNTACLAVGQQGVDFAQRAVVCVKSVSGDVTTICPPNFKVSNGVCSPSFLYCDEGTIGNTLYTCSQPLKPATSIGMYTVDPHCVRMKSAPKYNYYCDVDTQWNSYIISSDQHKIIVK